MGKADNSLDIVRAALVTALEPGVEPEAIQPDWELYTPPLRMDSLGFHRVIVGIERVMGRQIDDTVLAGSLIETVSDLCTLVACSPQSEAHEDS